MAYPRRTMRQGTSHDQSLDQIPKWRGYAADEDERPLDTWNENFHDDNKESRQRGVENTLFEEPEGEISEVESEIDPAFFTRDAFMSWEQITSDDTVGLYFKEMSQVPLLSLEEEINLAKSIENGNFATMELASSNGNCTPQQIKELDASIQDGRLARDQLIKANTRLVVSVAKKYVGHGVPFLDLIQEGNLGLMRAVEKFEYQRGFRFSTYATWWIRQTITRAIADQGRTIRVPVHMTDRIRQMYRLSYEMEQRLGRPATMDELATEMHLDPKKVKWMVRVSWTPISLESPIGDDDESELGMFVEDNNSPSPAQIVYQQMLRERVNEVLSTLSPREARILRLRFGLDNDRPYTLEEVGQKFGLTRERIRQIEGKALRRLRHPRRARMLREYL